MGSSMTLPDVPRMIRATWATWPAFGTLRVGPFTLREGRGAGRRVSAATAEGPVTGDEIRAAADAMREAGQDPLFSLAEDDLALDAALLAEGYTDTLRNDFFAIEAAALAARDLPRVGAFTLWPPLAIVEDIWAETEIDAARRRVIEAVRLPKTSVLSRTRDTPAGALFIAADAEVAMVHALVTRPHLRRSGAARNALIAAARWAVGQECNFVGLAVTSENDAATALYRGVGMTRVGGYHYRMLPKDTP